MTPAHTSIHSTRPAHYHNRKSHHRTSIRKLIYIVPTLLFNPSSLSVAAKNHQPMRDPCAPYNPELLGNKDKVDLHQLYDDFSLCANQTLFSINQEAVKNFGIAEHISEELSQLETEILQQPFKSCTRIDKAVVNKLMKRLINRERDPFRLVNSRCFQNEIQNALKELYWMNSDLSSAKLSISSDLRTIRPSEQSRFEQYYSEINTLLNKDFFNSPTIAELSAIATSKRIIRYIHAANSIMLAARTVARDREINIPMLIAKILRRIIEILGSTATIYFLTYAFLIAIREYPTPHRLLADPDKVSPFIPSQYHGQLRSFLTAINSGNLETVNRILNDETFNPNEVNPNTHNIAPLELAARRGHIEIIDRLLQDERIDPRGRPEGEGGNREAFATLYSAMVNGHLHVVRRLLTEDRIYPENMSDAERQTTALRAEINCAAAGNHTEALNRILIEHPAVSSAEVVRALGFALDRSSQTCMVRLLQDSRAYPNGAIPSTHNDHPNPDPQLRRTLLSLIKQRAIPFDIQEIIPALLSDRECRDILKTTHYQALKTAMAAVGSLSKILVHGPLEDIIIDSFGHELFPLDAADTRREKIYNIVEKLVSMHEPHSSTQ